MPRVRKDELNDRRKKILNLAVQEFILTGEPVASQRLVEKYGIDVSPATVRNDLAWLEEKGFLAQPHLSAGRVPTDEGYRFYVRTLGDKDVLQPDEKMAIRKLLTVVTSEIEDIYLQAADIIAEITCCFGLTIATLFNRVTARHFDLVSIGPRTLLAAIILDNGDILRTQIELEEEAQPVDVEAAEDFIHKLIAGRTLEQLSEISIDTGILSGLNMPEATRRLVMRAINEIKERVARESLGSVYLSRNADYTTNPELTVPERMINLLQLLNRQNEFLKLARQALYQESIFIKIGDETSSVFHDFSFIAAPYRVRGAVGAIGVLGPKRMDYARAISAVNDVSRLLSRRLYEIFES